MKTILLILLIASTIMAYDWAYTDPARTLRAFSSCWLAETGDENYEPMFDCNCDGVIDFADYAILWRHDEQVNENGI